MKEKNKKALQEVAESLIADSRNKHDGGIEDEECPGCMDMRTGLEILSLLGDPSVFRA